MTSGLPPSPTPDRAVVVGPRMPLELALVAAAAAFLVMTALAVAGGGLTGEWLALSLAGALSAGGAAGWVVARQRRRVLAAIGEWQAGREDDWRREEREIVAAQRDLIDSLSGLVESRSNETAHHTVRVGHAAAMLATLAGLDLVEAEQLRLAVPMHDIGKVGISDAILKKQGKLDAEEYEIMKSHTTIGHKLLARFRQPVLDMAAAVAHEHHEKWDGTGYPRGLQGEEISVYARIVAIADVYDALTSNRVYRQAMSCDDVLDVLRQARGSHFDPALLDVFLAHADRFTLLVEAYADPLPGGIDYPAPSVLAN